MREIMLAYADAPGSSLLESLVCDACGMFLPRDFGPCPICGGDKRDRNWPWLARGSARWMEMERHVGAVIAGPRSPP
jgi:hypothetical protein